MATATALQSRLLSVLAPQETGVTGSTYAREEDHSYFLRDSRDAEDYGNLRGGIGPDAFRFILQHDNEVFQVVTSEYIMG